MPERAKAVYAMANHLEGGISFNSIQEVAKLGPLGSRREIPMDEYYERFDGAFVAAVDGINWNRVLLEATNRHMILQAEDSAHMWPDYGDEICPECLCEALLSSGYQRWEDEPTASRTRLSIDRL